MKLYYLILAHTDLHQVDRMIKVLKHDHAEFYIHFDTRVPTKDIRKYHFHNTPGINVIRTRYKINWGGYNMIRATLSLMKAAAKNKEPGYLILLSGQDFPIKSPAFIYDFLVKNYGCEYLEHFTLPYPRWNLGNGLDRIQYYWFIDSMGDASFEIYEMQKSKNMVRPWFENFPAYGGSQWWCITTECATYILNFLRHNPSYEEYFEHCLVSDEIFFNTLVLNSPFKENAVNNNLKYIIWQQGNAHPRTLTLEDWQPIMNSECLWARKFVDSDGSSDILQRLESHIQEVNYPA